MVCNLVTYRARSAVREVGYALGFPRPLVDRVAKALETYDSVMVRRDLEADGGFAEFFRRPRGDARAGPGREAAAQGLIDSMGQLNHARGGRDPDRRGRGGGQRSAAAGRRMLAGGRSRAIGRRGRSARSSSTRWASSTRGMPLVGKVPPWKQPEPPKDPDAPQPFAWLGVEGVADGQSGAAGTGPAGDARRPRGPCQPRPTGRRRPPPPRATRTVARPPGPRAARAASRAAPSRRAARLSRRPIWSMSSWPTAASPTTSMACRRASSGRGSRPFPTSPHRQSGCGHRARGPAVPSNR